MEIHPVIVEVVRLGLASRFFSKDDLITWADEMIMELPTPPMWIIDLSLSSEKTDGQIANAMPVAPHADHQILGARVLLGLIAICIQQRALSVDEAAPIAMELHSILQYTEPNGPLTLACNPGSQFVREYRPRMLEFLHRYLGDVTHVQEQLTLLRIPIRPRSSVG